VYAYERMWNVMKSKPNVFVDSAEEGLKKVKQGGYAFILGYKFNKIIKIIKNLIMIIFVIESTTNDYLRSKDCELIQIGGIIDDKGYGIAAPSGSPWVNIISNAILKLKTYGELPELYQKWWKENKNCDILVNKNEKAHELGFSKLGGLFTIILFIMCLSFIILLIEILWNSNSKSKDKVNS